MAQITEEDLNALTDDQIREFFLHTNLEVLPNKVKGYIRDVPTSEKTLEDYARMRRVSSLLRTIIIKRFLYETH